MELFYEMPTYPQPFLHPAKKRRPSLSLFLTQMVLLNSPGIITL